MEARRRTWFDARGLVIAADGGERHLPFYAGALHYWRVPPIRWGASLRALHSLGLTCVETYVPWRVHVPESGSAGWSGERDLGRFLEAARAAFHALRKRALGTRPVVRSEPELPPAANDSFVQHEPERHLNRQQRRALAAMARKRAG